MVKEVVKFKIQITARRSATSFTAGGIGSDVTAAMTHMKKLYIASQFFSEFFFSTKSLDWFPLAGKLWLGAL